MANVAKDFAQLISQSKSNKTGPYDTQATVKRVEGNTVWVSIPGGVDETPIDKTVNCTAGDKVQVRVSGGRAWITGNASAPPTDDTTAIKARTTANEAQVLAVDAKETADAVEGIAVSASTTATTAKTIAEGVNEHFWHDSTGAHVTEVTQEEWNDPADPNYHSGGNTLITTQGMAIRDGMTNLAEFGASGQTFNNEKSAPIFEVRKLPTSTYANKANYTEYNNESPFVFDLPWGCVSVGSLAYYDSTFTWIQGISPVYTLAGDSIQFDSTACAMLQNNNVKYIKVNYTASGSFPYYTVGSDGLGDVGEYSLRVGENNVASGITSFASGESTTASGGNSHTEGYRTIASGLSSHAEGEHTEATGDLAHAEGYYTDATGTWSHAEGNASKATGQASHASNLNTIADQQAQTAVGSYNTANNVGNLFVVGNGNYNARSDAFTVDWSGNVEAAGSITVNNHSSSIGTTKIARPTSAVSAARVTYVELCHFTLEPGVWIIVAYVRWPNNSNGYRLANVATTSQSTSSNVLIPAVNGNVTSTQFTRIVEPTANTTYYLNAYHNSTTTPLSMPAGAADGTINGMYAIRIA